MKLRTTVGDTERHEVEAEQGWLGRRKVTVDGDDIIDKWAVLLPLVRRRDSLWVSKRSMR